MRVVQGISCRNPLPSPRDLEARAPAFCSLFGARLPAPSSSQASLLLPQAPSLLTPAGASALLLGPRSAFFAFPICGVTRWGLVLQLCAGLSTSLAPRSRRVPG